MSQVLTDEDVCRLLGRKTIGKLEVLVTADAVYRRDVDGTWYKLDGEPK